MKPGKRGFSMTFEHIGYWILAFLALGLFIGLAVYLYKYDVSIISTIKSFFKLGG